MQVVAFVQQLLSHGGYYDDQLDFIRIECIQVVATIVPGASAGRSQLSKRLVARLKIAVMGYPEPTQLEAIYARMLQQVTVAIAHVFLSIKHWHPAMVKLGELAACRIQFLRQQRHVPKRCWWCACAGVH